MTKFVFNPLSKEDLQLLASVVADISDIGTSYLAIDGSNANTTIDIGAQDFTTTGTVQGVTQAEFDTLTDDSMADALHRHSELSASDGTPDAVIKIDAAGHMGVNCTPEYWLDVNASAMLEGFRLYSSTYVVHDFQVNSNTAPARGMFRGQKSAGTKASPTAVTNGHYLFSILGAGWDGAGYDTDCEIDLIATQTHSASAHGAKIQFQTTTNSTAFQVVRMTIDHDGVIYANGKIALTQADGNEYIDSLNDGYVDIGATTGIRLLKDTTITEAVTITGGATTNPILFVDGITTDFTTAGSNLFTAKIQRDVNWNGEDIVGITGIYNQIHHLSAAATIVADITWSALQNEYKNTGKVTNASAGNHNLYGQPFFLNTTDTGTYDTSSTGAFNVFNRGMYISASNTSTLTDTGGNAPTAGYDMFGTLISVTNNPTISSGSWNNKTYGTHITVTGNTSGVSKAYGIYIASITGADENFAMFDNSGAEWAWDSDNQILSIGEEGDATLTYDGSDFIINPQAVGTGGLRLLNMKSGANQAGAGAAADELYKTASHATLPDNVVMIGV